MMHKFFNSNFFLGNRANISLLNVNNTQVQLKIFEAAQKWLRFGVDGIHFADYEFKGKVSLFFFKFIIIKFIYFKNSPKSIDQLIHKIRRAIIDDETIKQKDM